jgi:acyl-coenzyme A thioesterase PaaI-like protein
VGDPVLERALRAVGRTRALGLHFYGHFVGIEGRVPADGRAHLRLEGEPTGVGAPDVSPVALATLADLALGSAIRSRLRPGIRLGTVTLAIQHPAEPVVGPLEADATADATAAPSARSGQAATGGIGSAGGSILCSGRAVARAQGWFTALPAPPGRTLSLTPWERVDPPPVVVPTLEDLDERESAAVAAARAAGERAMAGGTAVSREILAFDWQIGPEGSVTGRLQVGPELDNRVGHVQGGALYGAATVAAREALASPTARLADGYYQFLRPANGAILAAEGRVVRRGRSVAFVEARLHADDTQVGAGLFSFRLP